MTGFIAFLFVVFLMLSGKYIVIGLFMLIFRILLTIYSIIAEILAAIFIPSNHSDFIWKGAKSLTCKLN
jgi:hypothetical protein